MPNVPKFKGLERVVRYKLAISSYLAVKLATTMEIKVNEYPLYLTVLYFKDMSTADTYDASLERAATRGDWHNVAKEAGASVPWRVQYEPMRTW